MALTEATNSLNFAMGVTEGEHICIKYKLDVIALQILCIARDVRTPGALYLLNEYCHFSAKNRKK